MFGLTKVEQVTTEKTDRLREFMWNDTLRVLQRIERTTSHRPRLRRGRRVVKVTLPNGHLQLAASALAGKLWRTGMIPDQN
jgi:hypothetical protein